MITSHIEQLQSSIAPARERLLQHRLYGDLKSLSAVQSFMETHVFAVWDFMSLLKALQHHCTGLSLPWVPTGNPSLRRFLNEIVLGEESDEIPGGGHLSHFELYIQAMQTAGADAAPILKMVQDIQNGMPWDRALESASSNAAVREFVSYSLNLALHAPVHEVASAFTFGREDLIPDLFLPLLKAMQAEHPELGDFIYYMERHIELDGDDHGPLSLQLMQELCGDDAQKWEEATRAACRALELRYQLWSSVMDTAAVAG
jgi:hypothetical protein